MSLTEGLTDGVGVQGLHTDTGLLTPLSNAQTVTTGTNKIFSLTVKTDGSWSYSVDGAEPTTGTNLVLDLNRNYRFAAYVRQDPGFSIQSISMDVPAVVTEIGDITVEILPGTTQMQFTWNSEVGVGYILESTTNLVNGTWMTITNIPGSGSPVSVSDEMDETNAFYRILLM
jgi:hypothetical protein